VRLNVKWRAGWRATAQRGGTVLCGIVIGARTSVAHLLLRYLLPVICLLCVVLSSLVGKDFKGSDGTDQYKYFVSVCGALTSSDASSCTQEDSTMAACKLDLKVGETVYDIGNYVAGSPPTFTYTDATKTAVQYTLSGAKNCWATGSAAHYQATIVLKCAGTQDPQFTVASPDRSCVKTFTLNTPLACEKSGGGGSASGKLSGGWVFIIILCVVIPVYVAGGCLYKSQKLGATGMDKCPNVEVRIADE